MAAQEAHLRVQRTALAAVQEPPPYGQRKGRIEAGGEEVVRRCELLIAIWNGRCAAGLGGTGDIVEHALKRERIVLWIDANQPERPVRVIRSIAYPAGDDAEVVSDPLPIDPRGWSRR